MKHPYVVGDRCLIREQGYVARILKIENDIFTLHVDRVDNREKGLYLSASIWGIKAEEIDPIDDKNQKS